MPLAGGAHGDVDIGVAHREAAQLLEDFFFFFNFVTTFTVVCRLHLVRVRLPKLSVALLPGIGVQLAISARLDLSGNW